MVSDTRVAREREAMRRQEGSHLEVESQPDAKAMGAESAVYTEPTIDPQWIDAWKMFVDRDGNEYGVPVKLPRGQWDHGGANALVNLRRPDGDFWFTLIRPERLQPLPDSVCFVGDCTKALRLEQLPMHVRTFHFAEAETFKAVLEKIEQQLAADDPRLQRVLAQLEQSADVSVVNEQSTSCDVCGTASPDGHPDPEAWLRGHKLGAHKDGG